MFGPPSLLHVILLAFIQTEKSRHLLQVREKMRMLETLKFSEEFGSELQHSGHVRPAEDSIPNERKDRLIRWVREGGTKWWRGSDV